MLEGLFGNRNVVRALLFLFVNERVYGAQLQSLFQIPLTPIQNALMRLEKEGVLKSHYEGKTRIFQWNPTYPLREELEALLKKVYTLLPSNDKKRYCFIHKPRLLAKEEAKRDRGRTEELEMFWQVLSKMRHLSFSAKLRKGEERIVRLGKAAVEVLAPASSSLIFQEKGHWFLGNIPHTLFSNMFRWTLDLSSSLITLEHLRYGFSNPVFLFHLTSTQPGHLESVDAHLCGDDTYLGSVVWNREGIHFYWRIIGPHKNEELDYRYF